MIGGQQPSLVERLANTFSISGDDELGSERLPGPKPLLSPFNSVLLNTAVVAVKFLLKIVRIQRFVPLRCSTVNGWSAERHRYWHVATS